MTAALLDGVPGARIPTSAFDPFVAVHELPSRSPAARRRNRPGHSVRGASRTRSEGASSAGDVAGQYLSAESHSGGRRYPDQVDVGWATERLNEWVELAVSARALGGAGGGYTQYPWAHLSDEKVTQLRARHDQTRRIVQRVLTLQQPPQLLAPVVPGRTVDVMTGVVLCQEALGRIRTDAETLDKLGSRAPSLVADQLHEDVWEAAARRWEAGNFSDAVQRAATFLNARIQDETGRHDLSDSELMREVFSLSPPAPRKPRLIWPGVDTDLSVRAMRVGLLSYSQGIFSAIRNITTHSVNEIAPQVALEQLAALSVMARWVDGCELIFAD